ncbi:hypothetical protein ETAA1_39960 [Urbifossiella limnaea]|uniref:N-acetyltransferase domain-containing protein n=1 Tax=Urbifossiella limnaea TaxID=2528023 RepID=A0A517XWY4_9BACT|nr:hypothetical protein ETAA1_39960 [Urbifossiella limnaea]
MRCSINFITLDSPAGSRPVTIRTYQPGDERTQAVLFNGAAFALPGFKPATEDDVRRRTRARGFDPTSRFYAVENDMAVGYCVLEPDQGRLGYPWCRKGYEAVAAALYAAAVRSARDRGVRSLFTAYRRDWDGVLGFFADRGFHKARDMVNYAADPVDLPTIASRGGNPVRRLTRADIPALAAMGRGVVRVSDAELEQHVFNSPHFPAEAFWVVEGGGGPVAVGVGLDNPNWPDVKKVDPLAPCFRLGAFGAEGLNAKRVNGLFSYVVTKPEHALPAGLALLAEVSQELTEGSVTSLAAQCPTDAPHLVGFYTRYFKEQGRFPVMELTL